MKTTNDPKTFLASLGHSTKVSFNDGHLKADVSRIEPGKGKRQIMIRYSEWVNGRWQSFSHYISEFTEDVKKDFMKEVRVFSISN